MKMPIPQTWAIDDLSDIVDSCELYINLRKVGEKESGWTEEEIFEDTGLSENDACNFVVYGLDSDKWYHLEFIIFVLGEEIIKLKNIIESLNKRSLDRYEIIKDMYKKIEKDD